MSAQGACLGGLIMGGLVPAQGLLTAYPKYIILNNTKPPEIDVSNEVYPPPALPKGGLALRAELQQRLIFAQGDGHR